jgi:hypothetical protein
LLLHGRFEHAIFPHQETGELDILPADAVRKELSVAVGGDVAISTWIEEHSMFLDALIVEKNVMFYLLFFIMIVAAFGIMSAQITFVVTECSAYADAALPSYPELVEKAWILRPRDGKRAAGFVHSSELSAKERFDLMKDVYRFEE